MADTPPIPTAPPLGVPIRMPDGNLRRVDAQHVQQALDAGASVLSAEDEASEIAQAKYGGLGNSVAAGALGVARGVSAHASDILANATLGKEYVEGIKAANPNASTAGEIGGVILPSLVTAGEYTPAGIAAALGRGAEATVAEAAGKGILGRALSMGAAGAAENAAYAGVSTVADSFASGDPLTTEKLFGNTAKAALYGGVAGMGLGAVSYGAGRGFKAVADKIVGADTEGMTASEALGRIAGDRAYKATGAGQAEFAALRARGIEPSDIGKWMLEHNGEFSDKGFFRMSPEDMYAASQKIKAQAGQQIDAALTGLDAEVLAAKNLAKDAGALAGTKAAGAVDAAMGPETAARNFLGNARKNILEPLEKNPFFQAEAAKVRGLLDNWTDASGIAVTAEQRSELKALIDANPAAPEAAQYASKLAELEAKTDALSWKTISQWRRSLDDKIGPKGFISDTPIDAQLKAVRAELESQIEAGFAKAGPDAQAAYQGGKAQYAKGSLIEDATEVGAKRDQGNRVFGLSEQMGILGGAAAGGPLAAMPAAMGQYMVKHYGNQVLADTAFRLAKTDTMKSIVLGVDQTSENALTRFLGHSQHAVRATVAIGAPRLVERQIANIQAAARDPQVAFQTLQRNNPDHIADPGQHPRIFQNQLQMTGRNVQWLAAQAPLGAPVSSLFPTGKRHSAPPHELAAWARKRDVFDDPVGTVWAQLQHGDLTPDHVDALDAMYPELAKNLRTSVMDQLGQMAQDGKSPPLRKLNQLGILLRTPTTPLLDPAFIGSQQALIQQGQQDQGPQEGHLPEPRSTPSKLAGGEDSMDP